MSVMQAFSQTLLEQPLVSIEEIRSEAERLLESEINRSVNSEADIWEKFKPEVIFLSRDAIWRGYLNERLVQINDFRYLGLTAKKIKAVAVIMSIPVEYSAPEEGNGRHGGMLFVLHPYLEGYFFENRTKYNEIKVIRLGVNEDGTFSPGDIVDVENIGSRAGAAILAGLEKPL